MLKVNNLKKSYKMKGGNIFKALDGVDLEFPKKGFVFIVGKSGSGKSTLLNILGGLDNYDDGEILIKGKSSTTFKGSDFDSYRNTYLGFIFQEFNLIENYTIENNIKLALQLQSFKGDIDEEVKEILETVELYDKRHNKIMEISGGQRQRVAIARALVKKPEIIIADEPTGNLDSNTSAIIMNILRDLSKEKLVIMVTHDVDYANEYADRVIEMHDGKVKSDYTKDYRTSGEIGITEGSKSGIEKVIRMPKSGTLNTDVVEMINDLVRSNSEKNLYLTLSFDKDIVSKIEPSVVQLSTEYKEKIIPIELDYNYDKNFKLIKSKLPLKNSLAMALGNINKRKFRLIFTFLILMVALFMFGFVENVNKFDYSSSVAETFEASNTESLKISKSSLQDSDGVSLMESTFENNEIDYLINEFSNSQFINYYKLPQEISLPNETYDNDEYYTYDITHAIDINNMDKLGASLVSGVMPNGAKEVLISEYLAEQLVERDTLVANISNLINSNIKNDNDIDPTTDNELTIVGIYSSDYSKFEEYSIEIKEITKNGPGSLMMSETSIPPSAIDEFLNFKNINSAILINDEFMDEFISKTNIISLDKNSNSGFYIGEEIINKPTETAVIGEIGRFNNYQMSNPTAYPPVANAFNVVTKNTSLKDNEVILNGNRLGELGFVTAEEAYETFTYEELEAKGLMNIDLKLGFSNYDFSYNYGYDNGDNEPKQFESIKDVKVVGYFYTDYLYDYDIEYEQVGMLISDSEFDKIANYKELIVNLSNDVSENTKLFKYIENNNYNFTSKSLTIIVLFDMVLNSASSIFFVTSIILAVFASVLLFSNISGSIMNKKKEIGTLRAIGARGSDVSKIFIFESIFITIITAILASIALSIITILINNMISVDLGYPLALFSTKTIVFAEMFLVAIVIGIISALLPTKKVTMMRPIDAIRNK